MANMKLRVRAATGGTTIRVQVPLLCTLQGLKDVLAPLVSLPASSFSLSLNKQDEIQGPGTAQLSAFGVTSGDLLYYIVGSSSPSSGPIPRLAAPRNSSSQPAQPTTGAAAGGGRGSGMQLGSGSSSSGDRGTRSGAALGQQNADVGVEEASGTKTPEEFRRQLCAAAADRRAGLAVENRPEEEYEDPRLMPVTSIPEAPSSSSASRIAETGGEQEQEEGELPMVPMEVEIDGASSSLAVSSGGAMEGGRWLRSPIPDLLQRVLASEVANIRQPSSYLVLAVHAVMLETGFIRINPTTGASTEGSSSSSQSSSGPYELPPNWSNLGLINLTYTVPELTRVTSNPSALPAPARRALGEEALLRCQIVGGAVVVYGAVTGGTVHRVCLSVSKSLKENLNSADPDSTVDGSQGPGRLEGEGPAPQRGVKAERDVFRNIFELWKEVKDSLSLPLLTFMCEETGLTPPPSLVRLPTELKIKVLESLPAIWLANLSCVCSEFRFLASGDELWRQRYREEFGPAGAGSGDKAPGGQGWKLAFVRKFESRRRIEATRRRDYPPGFMLRHFPSFGPHFGGPFGSDYFVVGQGTGPRRDAALFGDGGAGAYGDRGRRFRLGVNESFPYVSYLTGSNGEAFPVRYHPRAAGLGPRVPGHAPGPVPGPVPLPGPFPGPPSGPLGHPGVDADFYYRSTS